MKKTIKLLSVIFLILIFILNFSICLASSDMPDITAGAAILIDSYSGKILYGKNENERMYPASTTKILTAILAIENCNLNDVVTVPYEAISSIPSGYTVVPLQVGEQLTVYQLLQVMMVRSANDAANVLAYHISGSIDSFATVMNNKIAELGLKNTHFCNPSGQHDENHYTTASDLAILMQYCMKNSTFRSLAGLKSCILPSTNKSSERVFTTTNDLLTYDNREVSSNYYYPYAIAGKTGYTTAAKNCLVSVSDKDDFELICVVLSVGIYPNNLSGKFIETKKIFDYGYSNYMIKKLREKDAIATSIEVSDGTKETKNLDLLLSNDITAVIPQNVSDESYEPEIKLEDNISAPIYQGQILGKIVYNIDGIEYSADLKAAHNVDISSFFKLAVQTVLVILILYFLYLLLFDDSKNKKYRKKFKKNSYKM